MTQKSFLKENNRKNYIPEAFPLIHGMSGKKIESLQKELGMPVDGILGLQTEHHINGFGYILPLSEVDYNKIVKPEHIKIFEWIVKIIDQSDKTFHLDGCLKLIELLKQKFKRSTELKSEIESMTEILEETIKTKRDTIHTRNKRDRKNGN